MGFKFHSGADLLTESETSESRLELAVQCFCSALCISDQFAVHFEFEGRNAAGCLGLLGLDIDL